VSADFLKTCAACAALAQRPGLHQHRGIQEESNMDPIQPGRHDLLAAPLLAVLPMALASTALASPLNPAQTIIPLLTRQAWSLSMGYPERSVGICRLVGDIHLRHRPGELRAHGPVGARMACGLNTAAVR